MAMFRSFLDGLAAMVGWRVGEAVIDGARREIGRGVRHRNASAKAAYETELAEAAAQLPAGTAATALVVVSSSQIEPQLGQFTCLACDARLDLVQHRATTEDGIPVRALDLSCRQCGGPRTAYFRIERPS
jgi:hypothetical protein